MKTRIIEVDGKFIGQRKFFMFWINITEFRTQIITKTGHNMWFEPMTWTEEEEHDASLFDTYEECEANIKKVRK